MLLPRDAAPIEAQLWVRSQGCCLENCYNGLIIAMSQENGEVVMASANDTQFSPLILSNGIIHVKNHIDLQAKDVNFNRLILSTNYEFYQPLWQTFFP